MLRLLILKECRQQWRDRRFQITTLALLLLAGLSLFLAHRQYRDALLHYREGTLQERQRWVEQGPKNPHSAAHYGIFIFKPPSPLMLWDQGVIPFSGSTVFTEAHVKNDAGLEPAQQQSDIVRFGSLTPNFLLLYLVPLVLILSGFGLLGW